MNNLRSLYFALSLIAGAPCMVMCAADEQKFDGVSHDDSAKFGAPDPHELHAEQLLKRVLFTIDAEATKDKAALDRFRPPRKTTGPERLERSNRLKAAIQDDIRTACTAKIEDFPYGYHA